MDNEELLYNPRSSEFIGCSMQQSWADLAVWEKFLADRTLGSLIELGTGYCGLSTFFLLQCIQRDLEFLTFDIKTNSRLDLPLATYLNLRSHFVQSDIINNPEIVIDAITCFPKPLILFCDNGKKREEVELFVPHLSPGDYVVVHDWPAEINADDMKGFLITPIMHDECERWFSYTRFWRVK